MNKDIKAIFWSCIAAVTTWFFYIQDIGFALVYIAFIFTLYHYVVFEKLSLCIETDKGDE